MNKEEKKIIEFSQNIFLREGFYKTKVDDIASQLRISKKTIYKYFPAKEELVRRAVFDFLNFHRKNLIKIADSDKNAVVKLHSIFSYLGGFLPNINERFFNDVQTHLPDLWKEIDSLRTKIMMKNIGKIIHQGIEESLFIDKPAPIIINIFISSIRGIVSPEFLMNNKFSISDALNETIEVIMNSIMTRQGKSEFKLLKSEQENENN